jgi:hypothetical protein
VESKPCLDLPREEELEPHVLEEEAADVVLPAHPVGVAPTVAQRETCHTGSSGHW